MVQMFPIVYSRYIFRPEFICYSVAMQDYPGLKDAIAVTLRKLREAENMSKRQMAQKAFLERVYLIQLERGQKRPSVNALFYLSRALGIRPSQMLQMIEAQMESNEKENS